MTTLTVATGQTLRVLITSSRNWPWPQVIHAALEEILARLGPGDTLIIVHGDCPTGGDMHAASWAHDRAAHPRPGQASVHTEAHPADWSTCDPSCKPGHRKHRADGSQYCPTAGLRRNQDMVDTRPDRWLGLCLDDSTGTEHCIRAARKARLPGRAWYAYTPPTETPSCRNPPEQQRLQQAS